MSPNGLELRFEWESLPHVQAPELRATWARLETWVAGECASLVEEHESGAARRSIYGSLYPLAEWIAFNWWHLGWHARPAEVAIGTTFRAGRPRDSSNWWSHHHMRAAGDGQAWPNLAIVPLGATTMLAWEPDSHAESHLPVRFISRGATELSGQEVRGTLAGLVESVLTRLTEQDVPGTPLAKEWEAIQAADDEEAAFCRAAAQLGFDPYAIPDAIAETIVEAGTTLPAALLDDFLANASTADLTAGLRWTERALRRLSESVGPGLPASLASPAFDGSQSPAAHEALSQPWQVGYQQARTVRERLGVAPTELLELHDLVRVTAQPGPDRRLLALGGRAGEGGALVASRPLHPRPERFARARALWHLVHEPERSMFLLGPATTDRHRVARAFAAELIAPAAGIATRLEDADPPIDDEQLAVLADHFDASEQLIAHQITNQLGFAVTSA